MWKAHGLDPTRSRCRIWIKYQSTRWRRKTRSSCCRTFSETSVCKSSLVKYWSSKRMWTTHKLCTMHRSPRSIWAIWKHHPSRSRSQMIWNSSSSRAKTPSSGWMRLLSGLSTTQVTASLQTIYMHGMQVQYSSQTQPPLASLTSLIVQAEAQLWCLVEVKIFTGDYWTTLQTICSSLQLLRSVVLELQK